MSRSEYDAHKQLAATKVVKSKPPAAPKRAFNFFEFVCKLSCWVAVLIVIFHVGVNYVF